MSKWVVRKQLLGTEWFVWLRGHPQRWRFGTWREAVAFADRMARTREVVLPRITECGDRVPGAQGLRLGWEFAGGEPDAPVFWVEDEGSDVIYVQLDELRPLAAALLALAEQERA